MASSLGRVYSTLFIAAGGTPLSAGYTVPDGQVAVVRDIAAFWAGSPAATYAQLIDSSTGTLVASLLSSLNAGYDHWTGNQVFPAGTEMLAASSGTMTVEMRVSGFLLTEGN